MYTNVSGNYMFYEFGKTRAYTETELVSICKALNIKVIKKIT